MHRLFEIIKKAARTNVSIYISGETGVGKELVARAIHNESNRAKQPFVAVNVANFTNDLIESQLFGQQKKRHSDYEVWIMIKPSILAKH
jgi:DNA-binding NtrC family response regulator